MLHRIDGQYLREKWASTVQTPPAQTHGASNGYKIEGQRRGTMPALDSLRKYMIVLTC